MNFYNLITGIVLNPLSIQPQYLPEVARFFNYVFTFLCQWINPKYLYMGLTFIQFLILLLAIFYFSLPLLQYFPQPYFRGLSTLTSQLCCCHFILHWSCNFRDEELIHLWFPLTWKLNQSPLLENMPLPTHLNLQVLT